MISELHKIYIISMEKSPNLIFSFYLPRFFCPFLYLTTRLGQPETAREVKLEFLNSLLGQIARS
jgi:hypothetical protein